MTLKNKKLQNFSIFHWNGSRTRTKTLTL